MAYLAGLLLKSGKLLDCALKVGLLKHVNLYNPQVHLQQGESYLGQALSLWELLVNLLGEVLLWLEGCLGHCGVLRRLGG